MSKKKETIFALSTPPGKSALAIIRISGPNSFKSISKISSNMPKKPNQAKFNKILGVNGDIIDETITTYFKSPESFTGEDMIEISMHGGNAVLKRFINDYVKNNNIRMAKPGEFTRRAYENNKLDLIQAEAVADIVDAETEAQRKQAIGNLSGKYIKEIEKIFINLLH